jgi:pyruvate dehydrogenase E2 component (dihydrolipoamide acetyltransferase)
MAFEFLLPDLGEGIAEAEIRKWLVKAGDEVEEHQAVVEVETDKAVVEVPSPKKGLVLKIAKEEGEMVKVGETLIVLGEAGEKIGELKPAAEKPKKEEREKSVSVVGVLPEEEEEVKPRAAAPAVAPPPREGAEVLATPAVRASAKEQGVSLEKIKGTGPGGSITLDDVLKAKTQPAKAEEQAGEVERIAIRGLRKTIAKNLMFAQKTVASVTETEEADISVRRRRSRKRGSI